jgi:hypothetical protein
MNGDLYIRPTDAIECLSRLRRFIESDLFAALSSVEDMAAVSANYDSQADLFYFLRPFGPHLALNGEIHFGHKVSRKASFPGPRDPQGPQETFLVAGHLTRQRALEAKREGGADVISFF